MYLATPQRYPAQFTMLPQSPTPNRFFAQYQPQIPQYHSNTFRAQQPYQGILTTPFRRPSTPQAQNYQSTIPVQTKQNQQPKKSLKNGYNNIAQMINNNIPNNQQKLPISKTLPIQHPQNKNPLDTQAQMIQNLTKENQELKNQLSDKTKELELLKSKEEALEEKFKQLQNQTNK